MVNKDSSNNTDTKKTKHKTLNAILAALIIISVIILIYSVIWSPPKEDFEPKLPTSGIINIHEHIHKTYDAPKWLDAMEECGVSTTIMLGSPEATFRLNSPPGFNNYSINNEIILWLEKKYDSKILAFPTIDPRDPNKLKILKEQIDNGAVGLKLFSGHTGPIFPEPKETIYDYIGPLNRLDMYGVYEYCEKNRIPIIWHIKVKLEYLFNETLAVLRDFPNLIVDIPHFGVVGSEIWWLEQIMENYSGVYTDISFGGFAHEHMPVVSKNIKAYREFVAKFHDRVMFGTDMVVTNNIRKTVPWIVNLTLAYRDMLEKDEYYINVPNITGEGFNFSTTLNGFGLSKDILDEIYFENAIRFLTGKPAGSEGKTSKGNSIYSRASFTHYSMNILILIPATIFRPKLRS